MSAGRVQAGSGHVDSAEDESNFGDQYQGAGYDHDHDMTDIAGEAPTPTSTLTPSNPATPNAAFKDSEDFTNAEWQTIALGWRDFQNDLRHAARLGVRVWRMKVCVIAMSS